MSKISKISIITILCAVVLTTYITSDFFPFAITLGRGISMLPTLAERDFCISLRVKDKSDIHYGSIVSIDTSDLESIDVSAYITKRIIGKPYDQIDIVNNKVYRNGVLLNETYINSDNNYLSKDRHFTLSEDQYLVLGDNRAHSADSRLFGIVTFDKIRCVQIYSFAL